MSNFGFPHLRVVNPFEQSWREARSAVGAAPVLADAEEFNSVAESVADCTLVVGTTASRDRELQHALKTPAEASAPIHEALGVGRVAILFGSEKRGLSNDDLSHCHWLLRIPTRAEHGSMNLGQAVAVCLYELARERDNPLAQTTLPPRAAAAELERITAILAESLIASGYTEPGAAAATEEKVRRLVRRLDLSATDAELVLGMMRKILWKLRHAGRSAGL
jgi:tRNA/rRNA methyltransferase